ncbi:hypothetical protein GJ496_001023 [Pomphorhynchus laevis]|nr:hypothetical protein GJ496_001023 [Pomphorhynchus laevis]
MDMYDILKKLTRGLDTSLVPETDTAAQTSTSETVYTNDFVNIDCSNSVSQSEEAISKLRKSKQIHVTANLKRNILQFGYENLTPIQMQSIPILSMVNLH